MDRKGNNVRLTEEAHGLLAEMGHDCDASMKEVASEAIMRMFRRKQDNKRHALGAFALGSIAGGVLMFFVGALW